MKKISLVLCTLVIVFSCAEAILRYFIRWIPQDITGVSTVISNRGYALNPSSGVDLHQVGPMVVQYHYYIPHLRDTPRDAAAIPILVLGDSFTFGWLLPWKKTYVHHLQVLADESFRNKKYQFLNGGTGGWGTADYLAFLEEHGAEIAPTYVLIFLNTDDIGRAIKRNIYRLTDDHSLQLTENFHPLPNTALKKFLYNTWLFKHSLLIHLIRYQISQLLHIKFQQSAYVQTETYPIPASLDLMFEDTYAIRYGEALFLRIQQWCQQHHARLIVVTTGYNAFYPRTMHEPTKAFLSEAPLFFAKEGILYYDISAPFKKMIDGKNFQIPGDAHPNEFGSKAIAEVTWLRLKEVLKQGTESKNHAL